MAITNRKSKGKSKVSSSDVVSISIRKTKKDVTSFTSSGDEEFAFAADTGTPPISKTRSGRQYLKQYREPIVNSPQPTEDVIEQSTRLSMNKQKELQYVKALLRSGVGPSTPFCFDVMAYLANIPARVTLYELLRLSKSTRKALREELAERRLS